MSPRMDNMAAQYHGIGDALRIEIQTQPGVGPLRLEDTTTVLDGDAPRRLVLHREPIQPSRTAPRSLRMRWSAAAPKSGKAPSSERAAFLARTYAWDAIRGFTPGLPSTTIAYWANEWWCIPVWSSARTVSASRAVVALDCGGHLLTFDDHFDKTPSVDCTVRIGHPDCDPLYSSVGSHAASSNRLKESRRRRNFSKRAKVDSKCVSMFELAMVGATSSCLSPLPRLSSLPSSPPMT